MLRPDLNEKIPDNDFKDFYWLKEELVQFCRSKGINTSGGKIQITERIISYLETGRIITSPEAKEKRNTSKFDWKTATLTPNTVITDNYKNSENVREFMTHQIGQHFHFNTSFMKWMKENVGKTLDDAIEEWKRLYELNKDKNYKSDIAPQFQYNQYMRDFLNDNPDKTSKDAMNAWKIKRSLPGDKRYSRTDLEL